MGEADGCFAGLFHLIWAWVLAVFARKSHLGVPGSRDIPGLAVFCGLWHQAAVPPFPSRGALSAFQHFLDTNQGAVQPQQHSGLAAEPHFPLGQGRQCSLSEFFQGAVLPLATVAINQPKFPVCLQQWLRFSCEGEFASPAVVSFSAFVKQARI